jgi:thiamine biosynthesis protein ThiS
MQVYVNGEPQTVPEGAAVAELLERFGLAPQRVAVEVNEALVRRAGFAAAKLAEGDRVEIVTLVGGG